MNVIIVGEGLAENEIANYFTRCNKSSNAGVSMLQYAQEKMNEIDKHVSDISKLIPIGGNRFERSLLYFVYNQYKISPATLYDEEMLLTVLLQDFFQLERDNYDIQVEIKSGQIPLFNDLDASLLESCKTVTFKRNRIQQFIIDIYNGSATYFMLQPHEFEELVVELMRMEGFEVHLTKKTRDGGYDIMAFIKMPNHGALICLVECKLYRKQPVGIGAISRLNDAVQSKGANKGIIVTPTYYTKTARIRERQMPHLLELKDNSYLMQSISDYNKQAFR